LTEGSGFGPNIPALYITPKPIVTLKKYKEDMDDSALLLEKLIESKRGHNFENKALLITQERGIQVGGFFHRPIITKAIST
jgi:hypothetical protein